MEPAAEVWEPVEGVTLDDYARLCAGIVAHGIIGEANVNAWVEGRGVRAGAWTTVDTTWRSRVRSNAAARAHYIRIFGSCTRTPNVAP